MPVKLHQLDCSLPASASMPSASVVTASQPPRLFMAIVPTSSKPRIITEQWTTLAIAVPLSPPVTVNVTIRKPPMATPTTNGRPVTPLTIEPMT